MDFLFENEVGEIPYVISQILDTCVNGITLSDPNQPDNPLVYANAAFELITGYDRQEMLGKNCRFLHGDDVNQPELERIRVGVRDHQSVTVTLRNYRKDGSMFYNRFTIRPLFDRQGRLLYYLGIQYDVTESVRAREELASLNAQLEAMGETP
ncbi:PAS domain-containing protein [Candidatus Thiodictyon syntrophicum]|jgi:PAS domain S-box-containing protein|uniref:PAS sensor protein n=1 Tax=Candidatus Thiodictyon syntrophicum TaxID=1166950 RepID=A0A2K8U7Q1_9GAMM|nr:PAS domain-containing protein [Candidatus Thiodictyon syntrophicum]AUB81628.1 PAS sensor protein [Candidatus Thiodictyon syntrophicum]